MQLSKIWWITYSDVSLHKCLLDLKSKNESEKRFWQCSVIEKGTLPISTYWTNNTNTPDSLIKLSCIVDDVRLKFEMAREYILGVRVFRLFKEEECVGWFKKKKKIWTSDAFFMLIVTLNSGWRLRCNQRLCVMNFWPCYLGNGWFEAQDQVWATC